MSFLQDHLADNNNYIKDEENELDLLENFENLKVDNIHFDGEELNFDLNI
jgi:hypothetical protein